MGKQFGTPFKKGADWTGNRNGRPRKTVEPPPPPPPPPPDIKELAREKSAKALEIMASLMENDKVAASTRLAAATAIIDRGYGKPQQVIEATLSAYDRMTDEELFALLTGGGEIIEGEAIRALDAVIDAGDDHDDMIRDEEEDEPEAE